MRQNAPVIERTRGQSIEINKVLKNTYLLLSMTLIVSAVAAGASMYVGIDRGASLIMMLVAFGLLFVVHKQADKANGIYWIFAFTGLMGASLGPMLSHYASMPGGASLIMQALAGTGLIFFALSGYVLTSKKDFSFMGGFLFIGLIVAVVATIANIFLQIPALSLALSAAIIVIMSGLILYDTSRIINGGETNYIRATVSLYLNIFNIFVHLLHLLGVMGDD